MFYQGKDNTICHVDNVSDGCLLGLLVVPQYMASLASQSESLNLNFPWTHFFRGLKRKNLIVVSITASMVYTFRIPIPECIRSTCLNCGSQPGQHRVTLAIVGHQRNQAGMQITVCYRCKLCFWSKISA